MVPTPLSVPTTTGRRQVTQITCLPRLRDRCELPHRRPTLAVVVADLTAAGLHQRDTTGHIPDVGGGEARHLQKPGRHPGALQRGRARVPGSPAGLVGIGGDRNASGPTEHRCVDLGSDIVALETQFAASRRMIDAGAQRVAYRASDCAGHRPTAM
jgi:hypothetical protein